MATLDQLFDTGSQLALGLDAYLESFANLTAWDSLGPFLGARSLADVYLSPEVIDWSRLDRDARRRHRDADQRREQPIGREDDVRERWARVYARMRRGSTMRAVVLGKPGEGKTTLTRLTCRAIARRSLAQLRARRRPVAEIALPIWLRAEELMTAGSIDAAIAMRVPEQIRKAIEGFESNKPRPSAQPAANHILISWKRESTWLFIDALDEPKTKSIPGVRSRFVQI